MNIFFILISNFIFSWSLTKLFIKPFIKIIPDIPNKRSAHNIIKPRGGGVAYIDQFNNKQLWGHASFLFLLPLSLTGFIDDLLNISRRFRLFIQLSTSFFILYKSNYFDLINSTDNFTIKFCLIALIIFLVPNNKFRNFMDGIDGILSGSIITICFFASFC